MDRDALLRHLRPTHFESGDGSLALSDARRIAQLLLRNGVQRVASIGSGFERTAREGEIRQ